MSVLQQQAGQAGQSGAGKGQGSGDGFDDSSGSSSAGGRVASGWRNRMVPAPRAPAQTVGGFRYIKQRHGSPERALAFHQRNGGYWFSPVSSAYDSSIPPENGSATFLADPIFLRHFSRQL